MREAASSVCTNVIDTPPGSDRLFTLQPLDESRLSGFLRAYVYLILLSEHDNKLSKYNTKQFHAAALNIRDFTFRIQ